MLPDPYAGLEDFAGVIETLMHDPQVASLPMTLGELTATLSLLLRVYVLPDVGETVGPMILELCDKYADEIIRRYPYSEGYIDYLYGISAIMRGLH